MPSLQLRICLSVAVLTLGAIAASASENGATQNQPLFLDEGDVASDCVCEASAEDDRGPITYPGSECPDIFPAAGPPMLTPELFEAARARGDCHAFLVEDDVRWDYTVPPLDCDAAGLGRNGGAPGSLLFLAGLAWLRRRR